MEWSGGLSDPPGLPRGIYSVGSPRKDAGPEMTMDEADDIKRYFGVIAENLDSKIQAVAEGVTHNGEKLEQLGGKVDRVESRLDRVEVRLEQVDARLEQVDTRFEQVDARFKRLEGEMRQGFSELGKRLESRQPH